jgi:hypothetical protein
MDRETTLRDRSLIRKLIEALPEAVLVIGVDDRVIATNAAAKVLLPSLRTEGLLARSLRSPDVLDTVGRVRASGRAERVIWVERFPVERLFEVSIAPIDGVEFEPALVLSLHDLSESRLRRCSALSRHCRDRRATMMLRAANSWRSCANRHKECRAWSMISCRCRASSSISTCGQIRPSISSAFCATSSIL